MKDLNQRLKEEKILLEVEILNRLLRQRYGDAPSNGMRGLRKREEKKKKAMCLNYDTSPWRVEL